MIVSICLCAVGCTAGVFTTLSLCRNLNRSISAVRCWTCSHEHSDVNRLLDEQDLRPLLCLLSSRQKHLPTRRLRRFLKPVQVPVLACSWLCSFVSSPRAHPCCWVCSFVIHHVVLVCPVTTLPFELCPLSGFAARECVILAPRAPNSHHQCNVMPRVHQGLGCLDEPLARPRADPRALLRTHSHVLRVSRALLATVSLAWSWIPPCDSPQLSPLRLALCLMVSGHFSTQTCMH